MKKQLTPIVSFRAVNFYYNSVAALADLTVDFGKGLDTVLFGGNGAGKSTLLGLIAGVEKPTSGAVLRNFSGLPAFVLQNSLANSMLPLSVEECVNMGRWVGKRPWSSLSKADRIAINDAIELLEIGPIRHRQLSDISGGQRQRALLAQGVAQGTELLLLDEPATGLDLEATSTIARVIKGLVSEGLSVVQASHDLAVAKAGDRVLLLREGKLIQEGTPAEVLTASQLTELF